MGARLDLQLDLNALHLKPCALGQSCFSRVTYANQSLSVMPMEPFILEPILFSEKRAHLGLSRMKIYAPQAWLARHISCRLSI
jgi:hypothetical protein